MKTTLLIRWAFGLAILFGPGFLAAQNITIDFDGLGNSATVAPNQHSAIFSNTPAGQSQAPQVGQPGWEVNIHHLGNEHASEVPTSQLDSLKMVKTEAKRQAATAQQAASESFGSAALSPTVRNNFKGNAFNNWWPPDNDIAVSDQGFVVSVTNSSLFFSDKNGNIFRQESFNNFFSTLGLSSRYFDPRVMYDPSEDKFIMIVINGNTPNNNVVVAFSTTEDPRDSWWFYTLEGDPQNGTTWFDFPSVGLSTDELYISGNLFDADDDFQRTLIYQIDKGNGFEGGNISWMYWGNVRDADNRQDFTVAPISYGFNGTLGPGIFFLSSDSGGGDEVMLYWTTGTIDNNPSLEVNRVSVSAYSPPGNGFQRGSNDVLDTGDNRMRSGFYADETVHFVLHTDRSNGYTGLYYGRIDVPNLTATRRTIGLEEFEYAYPAVVPFAEDTDDKSVLIGFLRTGASIYPECRVITCDENFDWSSSVQVRGGSSGVDVASGSEERWGDYSGIARRHRPDFGVEREVWVAGCYGNSQDNQYREVLSTWIAQIGNDPAVATTEVATVQLEQPTVFPNPSTPQERISVEFEVAESVPLNFYLTNALGEPLHHLFYHRCKAGQNLITFNSTALTAGTYFLLIQNAQKETLWNEKIIVH